MNIDDFISLFNGTSVDFDDFYGNQCVDLVQFYSRWLGGQRFTGNAVDIFNQAGSFYEQITNTPDNFPQKGDIVVWSGAYNGGPGHVGIAISGDQNTFACLEQNDPTNSPCHIKSYSYNCVLGWLRPKTFPQDQSALLSVCNADRDANWNISIGIFNQLGLLLDPQDKPGSMERAIQKIKDLQTQSSVPPPPVPPMASDGYKPYLENIKGVVNEIPPWWDFALHDQRIDQVKAEIDKAGI